MAVRRWPGNTATALNRRGAGCRASTTRPLGYPYWLRVGLMDRCTVEARPLQRHAAGIYDLLGRPRVITVVLTPSRVLDPNRMAYTFTSSFSLSSAAENATFFFW
jgi:hypothetical protein